MKTATELMEKHKQIKFLMEEHMSNDESNAMWQASIDRLKSIIDSYGELPKGVQDHTNRIFPFAAVYLTVKEKYGENVAFGIVEDYAISCCISPYLMLSKLMKVPGMPGLFVKLWDPITKKMFGASCGFKNVFYQKKKGEYRMDIISCPYYNYLSELGCPEITKIFCENDERVYGKMPGVVFKRNGTIGKGADRCDFYIKKI